MTSAHAAWARLREVRQEMHQLPKALSEDDYAEALALGGGEPGFMRDDDRLLLRASEEIARLRRRLAELPPEAGLPGEELPDVIRWESRGVDLHRVSRWDARDESLHDITEDGGPRCFKAAAIVASTVYFGYGATPAEAMASADRRARM